MRCVAVKMAPRRMQTPPTAMYAIPRKLLRPPITVRVVRRIDLVPLYSMVGKSASIVSESCSGATWGTRFWVERTIVNSDLIDTRYELIGVISHSQLAEGGKTSRPHPDLESLPLLQVWRFTDAVVGVAIGICVMPVWRGQNLRAVVLGRPVEVFVAVPGNALVRHVVGSGLAVIWRVLPHRRGEAVVEHGVGN